MQYKNDERTKLLDSIKLETAAAPPVSMGIA